MRQRRDRGGGLRRRRGVSPPVWSKRGRWRTRRSRCREPPAVRLAAHPWAPVGRRHHRDRRPDRSEPRADELIGTRDAHKRSIGQHRAPENPPDGPAARRPGRRPVTLAACDAPWRRADPGWHADAFWYRPRDVVRRPLHARFSAVAAGAVRGGGTCRPARRQFAGVAGPLGCRRPVACRCCDSALHERDDDPDASGAPAPPAARCTTAGPGARAPGGHPASR